MLRPLDTRLLLIFCLTLLPAVAGAQLVVNEIDYDQDGTDTAEFVEIKNISNFSEDLSAYSVRLVNGTGGGATIYDEIFLPAVDLAAGDYYVICGDAANVANCDLDDDPDSNFIQNGAPDAVAIAFKGFVIDTVSYEGDTGAPYTEGSGSGLEDDSQVAMASISRIPDGADTDQNNVDLRLAVSTPGEENEPIIDPDLDILVTQCPGEVTVDITGMTPNGTAAILFAPAEGSDPIPAGPCAGEVTGLSGLDLLTVVPLDATGSFSITVTAPSTACGAFLQAVDAATCSLSNVDGI